MVEAFNQAAPDLSNPAVFATRVRLWLRNHKGLIDAWQIYCDDRRGSPAPYLDGCDVGFFDGISKDYHRHKSKVAACTDYIYREANWVLNRKMSRLWPTPIRARFVRPDAFEAAVSESFRFLVEGYGYRPIAEKYRVTYSSSDLSIVVAYDDFDGSLATILEGVVGGRHPRAGLSCLYVAAKLGPAQRIKEIARTDHSLQLAVKSQASALRQLLPILAGSAKDALMLECHGR